MGYIRGNPDVSEDLESTCLGRRLWSLGIERLRAQRGISKGLRACIARF